MDADQYNAIPDCKQCHHWKEYMGKCVKRSDVDCPKGVKPKLQQVAITEYRSM